MSDIATIRHHVDLARTARDEGDGKEAAHQIRNAGAALAQLQQAEDDKVPAPTVCSECGRKQHTPQSKQSKTDVLAARTVFRNARGELGVDATAAPVETRDNEGRLKGYGLVIHDTNPNG